MTTHRGAKHCDAAHSTAHRSRCDGDENEMTAQSTAVQCGAQQSAPQLVRKQDMETQSYNTNHGAADMLLSASTKGSLPFVAPRTFAGRVSGAPRTDNTRVCVRGKLGEVAQLVERRVNSPEVLVQVQPSPFSPGACPARRGQAPTQCYVRGKFARL